MTSCHRSWRSSVPLEEFTHSCQKHSWIVIPSQQERDLAEARFRTGRSVTSERRKARPIAGECNTEFLFGKVTQKDCCEARTKYQMSVQPAVTRNETMKRDATVLPPGRPVKRNKRPSYMASSSAAPPSETVLSPCSPPKNSLSALHRRTRAVSWEVNDVFQAAAFLHARETQGDAGNC